MSPVVEPKTSSEDCPTNREAECPMRKPGMDVAPTRNSSKESLTACEMEFFLSLAVGDRIHVADHETGTLWRGRIDLTSPEHGFAWLITDYGERKLADIAVHSLRPPEQLAACGTPRRESPHR